MKKEKLFKYGLILLSLSPVFVLTIIKNLQNKFRFEVFIRNKSQETIQQISELSIIEDISKIIEFDDSDKLTNAKKLMKIRTSPVLQMDKNTLMRRLRTIPRFKDKLKFNEDESQIKITTKKDVTELLKILNDDYLRSDLTDQNYDSPSKTIDNGMQ